MTRDETPLDIALVWGAEEIVNIIRKRGGVSTCTPTDWSGEFGGAIIQHIDNNAGRVLPISLSAIVPNDYNITQRLAIVNKKKNKLLFTIGLFYLQKLSIELMFVLPGNWNMRLTSAENQFPSHILLRLSGDIANGNLSLAEGDIIRSTDSRYSDLHWPAGVVELIAYDHNWSEEENSEEKADHTTVNLLTLVPIKKSTDITRFNSHNLAWSKLVLKI